MDNSHLFEPINATPGLARGRLRFTIVLAQWLVYFIPVGIAVRWSRVLLGVHFPFDVLAALPVAATGALGARALRHAAMPATARVLYLYDHLANAARSW